MRQSIVNDLKIGVRLSVEIQKVIEKAEKTTGRLTGCDEYDIKVLASGPFAVHFFAPPEKGQDYYSELFSKPLSEIKKAFDPEKIISFHFKLGSLTKREVKILRDYAKSL